MNMITKKGGVILAIAIMLLSSYSSFAQKKRSSGSSSYNWSVGLKLGDPTGVTVKKYNGNNAWEFIIGRSGYYYGGASYYNYRYNHDSRYKNKGYYGYYYERGTAPIAIQVRHLFFHKPINVLDGLTWYAGVGGQLRYSSYYYHYFDAYGKQVDKVSDFGIGPDGVIGLEYTLDELPISFGLDVNLYVEIFDRPLLLLGQGGLAVRYNF